MSLSQEQKDTIREELRDRFMGEITNLDYHCDYIIEKLDQAYQSGFDAGAQDKVEEVILEIRKALASEGALSMSVEKRLETLLKDNR
jgi:hypothetical protein